MKRRYTACGVRGDGRADPGARAGLSLSSDFIVGFPGESEEDFEETLALVRRVRFGSLFGFRYSPRPGTAAARWGSEAEVPDEVSAARLKRLLDLQTEIQHEINRGLVGREFEILVEGEDRRGQSKGRTSCNRIIHVEDGGTALRPGEYVPGAGRARPPEFAGRKTLGVGNPGEAR